MQTKISKGELKAAPQALPANATDEQKTAWRQANGLPATKEDYVKGVELPKGMVLGEADKPLVESFAQRMFEQGGTVAEMNRAVQWFYETQDAQAAAQQESDGKYRVDSEVALRTAWQGQEYDKNMSAFGAFRSELPSEMQALLFSARTHDGQLLGNHPEFVKIGAALGRLINPAASVVLQGGAGATNATVDSRIAEIEGQMYTNGKPNDAYWKGESGAKMQAEYRELLDTRERMKARGRAA